MATAKLVGMDEAIANLLAMPEYLRGEVTRRAVTEGAEILQADMIATTSAFRSSKRHKGGQGHISDNIIIHERRNPEAYLQAEKDNAIALLVGPSKKAFHAYFVEHGWNHPIGPRITYTTKRGDRWNPAGHTYTTGRLKRGTGRAAHSQMGTSRSRFVAGKAWAEAVFNRSGKAAREAMISSYRAAIARWGSGKR